MPHEHYGNVFFNLVAHPYRHSVQFVRFNVAERATFKADMERRTQEREAREQREMEAVAMARQARKAAMPKPLARDYTTAPADPSAHAAFESLRQRAEEDVVALSDETIARKTRPHWGPPLIIEGELLDTCIELGYLGHDDPPIARLWGSFADPKAKHRSLRERLSSHPLVGVTCRGFQLHAGGERGPVGNILFEAQRDENGEWQFGPRTSDFDYHSRHDREWGDLMRERERYQIHNYSPKDKAEGLARTSAKIAEIEAKDQAAAKAYYRRQDLRRRVIELAGLRVLDFAGAPGVQMVKAGRLWGHCCICGRTLTDPISVERGIGPECIVHVAAGIKFRAANGAPPDWIAAKTGMPIEFVTITIEEGKVEAEAAAEAKAARDALLATIPQNDDVITHRVNGFKRSDHKVNVVMIVDVNRGSNEGPHKIAESIAGEDYRFITSCNIDHPVNTAAKNRLFFSEEELFEAAPELRPPPRRGRRASRKEDA